MATENNTLSWHRGEAVTITFSIPASTITGWALTFEFFTDYSATATFSKTVGSGITITTTTAGTITITHANTVNLTPGSYDFVLRRTDSGSETLLAYGKVALKAPKAA